MIKAKVYQPIILRVPVLPIIPKVIPLSYALIYNEIEKYSTIYNHYQVV